ncbi:MAG: glycoside hydrolase family 26 protein [Fimbriimonadaceae bacterium]|nr:glycoside hydrolase family 26 protein [Fimbriimonadaceae bacterium]
MRRALLGLLLVLCAVASHASPVPPASRRSPLVLPSTWFESEGSRRDASGTGGNRQVASRIELKLFYTAAPKPPPKPPKTGLAKFEPAVGCYLGAYIELDPKLTKVMVDSSGNKRKLPEEFEGLVGKEHAMYFFYLGYGRKLPKDWVNTLANRGKLVHIALEPNDGLGKVQDDAYLQQLADDLAQAGVPIFLRFASEMNGDWTNYNGNPALYKEKWRLVAETMRDRAENVAMVWCPYTTPRGNIDDYYPGDEWVDWVGVNMYNVTYFNQDPDMPAHHVEPTEMLDDIYRKYSKRKPIMIGEYATTHYSALENRPVIDFAISNIRELYSALPTKYPRVKAVNYFNSNNLLVSHRQNNNYTVTGDKRVLAAYQNAISSNYYLGKTDIARPKPPKSAEEKAKETGRLPLNDGAIIKGRVLVSAWLPAGNERSFVRALVDGKVVNVVNKKTFWESEIDPSDLGVGDHKLTFEAYDARGRLITARTIYVSLTQ